MWCPSFQSRLRADGEREYRVVGHELVDEFLEFASGRARPATVRAYAHDLSVFFGVVDKEPADVTPRDVLRFVTAQRQPRKDAENVVRISDGESGLSPATIKRRLAAVSSLYGYLVIRSTPRCTPACSTSRPPSASGPGVLAGAGARPAHESKRPGLPNISSRPNPVGDRSELGHWEGDQITGANNTSSMLTLTERVTRTRSGSPCPRATRPRPWSAAWSAASSASRRTCSTRSPLTRVRSERSGRSSPTPTTSTSGSATPIRLGNVVSWRTRTGSGAGGSHGAPTSRTSSRRTPITSARSSTESDVGTSATRALLRSMLLPPCSDHWNLPSPEGPRNLQRPQ